jgi:hypothetical protein
VLVTATKSYGLLLDAAGSDIVEFLENLNIMHDRITSTFLNYVPPEFHVTDNGDGYTIRYISKRQGLTPFVVGLLKGLAIRFDCKLDILNQVEVVTQEGTNTTFKVEITQL